MLAKGVGLVHSGLDVYGSASLRREEMSLYLGVLFVSGVVLFHQGNTSIGTCRLYER